MRLYSTIHSFISAWRDDPREKGASIGQRFEVQEVLGEGSYGITYKCLDRTTGKEAAVKQARPSKGDYAVQLLNQEAEIINALQHPDIPAFIELFQEKGRSYLVMSYMEGDTLEDLIFGQEIKYDEKQTVLITLQLLHLIEYVHSQGYVHLDLRIPNVLFHRGRLKLIDFGLARKIGTAPLLPKSSFFTRISAQHRSCTGKIANEQADLYDLGHFMLFMLYSTYEVPVRETVMNLHTSHTEQSWQEELRLSAEVKLIIERLLGIKQPFPRSDELKAALTAMIST